MRALGSFLLLAMLGCGDEAPPEPPEPVEAGGTCAETLACAKGLHCTEGRCSPPADEAETLATEIAELERKIARTEYLEAKAFTEQGKQKMRDERVELRVKLDALRGK